jgi:ligand-binding sensor domain-containing protein
LKDLIRVILFVFCLGKVFTQTINFKNYTTESGLPQSQILALFQDQNNLIWIGTNSGGAASFDGQKFTVYNELNGLNNKTVNSITQFKDQIAFGTYSGVDLVSNNQKKHFGNKDGVLNENVLKLLVINDSLIMATQKGVYYLYKNQVKEFKTDSLLSESVVYNAEIDKENNLWFSTLNNGLSCYNFKTKKVKWFNTKNGLNNNTVFVVKEYSKDTMLIGTSSGLFYLIKGNQLKPVFGEQYSLDLGVTDIIIKNKVIYASAYNKGVLKISNGVITKVYNQKTGLSKNAIRCVLMDKEENLWIGTDGDGIFKKSSEMFSYINKNQNLIEDYISYVYKDGEDLWLSVKSNGVAKFSNGQTTNYTPNSKNGIGLSEVDINAIIKYNDNLYLGTNSGLTAFKNEKFSAIEQPDFTNKYILSLYKSSQNNLYIGTSEGLFELNNSIIKGVDAVNKFIFNNELIVYKVIEDNAKKLLIATNIGLIEYKNGIAKIISKVDDTPINSLCCDIFNNYWIGTELGLYLLAKNELTPVLFEKKKMGYVNFTITKDGKTIYVGTNNGLYKIKATDYYKQKEFIKHYTTEDGLLSLESNVNAAFIDEKNRLLVGTVKGLEIYSPSEDKVNNAAPNTKINSIKLFFGTENINYYCKGDTNSALPQTLILPHNKNNLTFNFVGISFTSPEKVKYQYRRLGLEDNWSPITTKFEITYPSIPPGTYTFMVKSCNSDGVWNDTPSSYAFTINPPWYKTWWFYSACIIFVIGIVIVYNKQKVKKLIADRERLEQIVNVRTLELRKEKEKVEEINKEVIAQKILIEEKQKNIIDSINYAKRIQTALMPTKKYIERYIK